MNCVEREFRDFLIQIGAFERRWNRTRHAIFITSIISSFILALITNSISIAKRKRNIFYIFNNISRIGNFRTFYFIFPPPARSIHPHWITWNTAKQALYKLIQFLYLLSACRKFDRIRIYPRELFESFLLGKYLFSSPSIVSRSRFLFLEDSKFIFPLDCIKGVSRSRFTW